MKQISTPFWFAPPLNCCAWLQALAADRMVAAAASKAVAMAKALKAADPNYDIKLYLGPSQSRAD